MALISRTPRHCPRLPSDNEGSVCHKPLVAGFHQSQRSLTANVIKKEKKKKKEQIINKMAGRR